MKRLSVLVLWVVGPGFLVLAFAGCAELDKQSVSVKMPTRGICVHRGGLVTHPENTIAAFREAVRLGVQAIEFDVHMTRDGQIVVIHDRTVDRTTDGTGNVSELTLAELKQLDAGRWKGAQFAGERIPTLEETLQMMPENVWLFIHMKYGPDLVAGVTREIVRHRRRHQCMLLVASQEGAQAARQIDPEVYICSMHKPGYDTHTVMDAIARGYNAVRFTGIGSPENVQRLKEANVRILFCCLEGAVHPPSLQQLFDAGIDFPFVNDPAKLMIEARKSGIEPVKPVYRTGQE